MGRKTGEELEEVKKKYGDDRRSFISTEITSLDDEDLIPEEDIVITLTEKGYIKRMSNDEFKAQHNRRSLSFKYHDAKTTVLEGILARGDRKLSAAIVRAYEKGCLYDAWTETFHFDRWMEAFEECGIDPDFYTIRPRSEDELFPWDFIDPGVTKAFLLREWKRAQEGVVTPNGRMQCSGCGVRVFGEGVCVEN